jgi:hypothetical protein
MVGVVKPRDRGPLPASDRKVATGKLRRVHFGLLEAVARRREGVNSRLTPSLMVGLLPTIATPPP